MSCNKWYGPYIGARTHGRDHPFQPFIRHVSLVIPHTHVGPSAHCQLDRAEVIPSENGIGGRRSLAVVFLKGTEESGWAEEDGSDPIRAAYDLDLPHI